jgi:ATP-binding cassette subfamily C exporter for protease/lipase
MNQVPALSRILNSSSFTGIVKSLKQFRFEFAAIVFFSAIVNLLMLSPTLYMLQVFDRVLISKSEFSLYVLSAFVLIFYFVQAIAEWIRSKIMIAISLRIESGLNERLIQSIFKQQLYSSKKNPVQPLNDLAVVRQWITSPAVFAAFDLPWSVIYLCVMFLLHPLLGILTVVFMIILGIFAWWAKHATKDATEDAQDEEREQTAFVYSKLRNAEVIEAHGMVSNLEHQWIEKQMDMLKKQSISRELEERFIVSSKELRVLMQSLALGAGALLALNGEISFGAMIAASLLVGRATSPIDQIVGGWKGFSQMLRALDRLEGLLKPERQGLTLKNHEPPNSIDCQLRSVTAFVNNFDRPILEDINLSLKPGCVYALIGPSGAGKSTLGRVLIDAWQGVRGEVLINNTPISTFDRDLIGPSIGYLPQDVELFSGSIAENIARMGKPDSEKVIAAANLAGIHELILRFSKGYDTQVGEAGSYLSGGQRQRVALARALYGEPRFMVLDEPNANLDESGQRALSEALKIMKQRGCLIVLITHQSGLLDAVDEIIYLSDGKLQIQGQKYKLLAELSKETRQNQKS